MDEPELLEPDGDGYEALQRWVDKRLNAAVGLSTLACHQVAGQALFEMRRAPRRGSAGARGVYAYEGGLAEFTVQCEQAGYERADVMNLPMMLNEERKQALIYTSGNAFVGTRGTGLQPRTRYKKGGVAHHAIRSNRQPEGQAVLGEVLSFQQLPTEDEARFRRVRELLQGFTVRYMLTHFDLKKREVRTEVSTPESVQPSEFIDRWSSRIWVPPLEFTEDIEDDEGTIDFDIEPI